MRKTFLILGAYVFLALTASAQTKNNVLQLLDANGKPIANGATIVIGKGELKKQTSKEPDENGEEQTIIQYVAKPNITVKNISGEAQAVALKFNTSKMPNGKAQCCFGECKIWEKDSEQETTSSGVELKANDTKLLDTEWFSTTEHPQAWTMDVTVGLCKKETNNWGTTSYQYDKDVITIHIVFDETKTAIKQIASSAQQTNKIVARYNAKGQRINTPCKGINIIKYANGTTIKQIKP